MVSYKNILFTLIAVLCFSSPSQATARKINNIIIIESGLNANPEIEYLNKGCALFKPTIKQIKNYLSKAYPAPKQFGLHERWSSCYASGTAEFENFGTIKWTVGSGGEGAIKWNNDEYSYVFYKHNRWFDPTACTYGLGDKGEC
ncbi:hypothetical protein [Comamonas composti]|uniref:hypothetical protein n=1 Tax=Comamonas composti TaxID=408558 RepID=UPI0012EC4870|nr:hypothetical protein [Comamonas composti]